MNRRKRLFYLSSFFRRFFKLGAYNVIGRIFFPGIILVSAGIYGIAAVGFPEMELQEGFGPGLFPKLIALVVAVLCVFEIMREVIAGRGQEKSPNDWGISSHEFVNSAILVVAVVVALILMPHVGFVVAGTALVMFLSVIMGLRPLWKSLVASALITTGLYGVFSEGFGVIF